MTEQKNNSQHLRESASHRHPQAQGMAQKQEKRHGALALSYEICLGITAFGQ